MYIYIYHDIQVDSCLYVYICLYLRAQREGIFCQVSPAG